MSGITPASLAGLLSPAIGDAKAESVVREAMLARGRSAGRPMSVDEALAVLERIAETPGIVGVSARFAKSRVHLMG